MPTETSLSSATARLFFALRPLPALCCQLDSITEVAARRFGGRATPLENLHLTLVFLGEVPLSCLPELCLVATRVRAAPFELNIDHLGFWPAQHLLWAGCPVTPALSMLVGHLQAALLTAGLLPSVRRQAVPSRFTPHLTLLRKTSVLLSPSDFATLPAIFPLPWLCSDFVLMRSFLTAKGAVYQSLAEFSLSKA